MEPALSSRGGCGDLSCQPRPGLHPKQVQGGGPAPLLCWEPTSGQVSLHWEQMELLG